MAAWSEWLNKFAAGDDDEDDNEEEGGYQRSQWGSRDGLIFLIDCTKSMFVQEEEQSPFELCIKCAKNVIQNKIISSDKDLLGIVFFGTEKEQNPSDFKHVYIFHDLDQPGAERVLALEALLEEPGNNDFKKTFGHSDGFSLSDALWTCSNMFSNSTHKIGYKRIMLFTNNDNPHAASAQLRKQAITKANDLHENGIQLDLMHMNKAGGDPFDISLFYKDVLIVDEDEDAALPDPAERFEELLTRVRSKDHKKRAMTRLPFSLGKDLDMAVGVYNLVRPCYKPSAVRLYKKTNEEIKTVSKKFLATTGEVLMPQDMKKAQSYGGKLISFEKEEVDQIKSFDTPGLKLMGFKPRSKIKWYHHVKPAQFIYPDENVVSGSTNMFSALLKKCLERDVVAYCRYIPRKNTPPRFVALVPQAEELDEHKVQVVPPGFHLIFMPFADDFRKISYETDLPRANPDQIDKAKDIVKKLQFTFRSENFDNPALQKHYANVEAMALERDEVEELTDYTLPNEERMQKRAGTLFEEFKDLVFPDGYEPGKAGKRGAGGGGAAAKKPRLDVEVNMEMEARAGKLGKLTVPILKEFIKKNKITAGGTKKADLIDAINSHFGL